MHSPSLQPRTFRHCAVRTDRRSLLLGTALASTLLLGTLTHPSPASALTCAGDIGTGPAPISHLNVNDFIYCINTEARTNAAGDAIDLSTINAPLCALPPAFTDERSTATAPLVSSTAAISR
jgi:hypothetical protein